MKDIGYYTGKPERFIEKKPFTRGCKYKTTKTDEEVDINQTIQVEIPTNVGFSISQETYLREYNPSYHSIHDNKTIPAFKCKIDGNDTEIIDIVVASSRQKNIHAKQCLHLCGYDMDISLLGMNKSKSLNLSDDHENLTGRTEEEKKSISDFAHVSTEWVYRNMKKYRDKIVSRQKSTGDAALLFTFDPKQNKTTLSYYSYSDGYTIIPNYNDYGKEIACTLYYKVGDNHIIKVHDDTYIYTYIKGTKNTNKDNSSEFILSSKTIHGYDEIPLKYKRGWVAWEFAQSAIEMREVIMAINSVVMKRHGWSMMWVYGNIENSIVKNIQGFTILNDKNPDMKGDAKILEIPEAKGINKMLDDLDDEIQVASSTTIILPKYIKTGGDISGTAAKIMMSMDYELALQTANDWQDFADGMMRMFLKSLDLEEGLIGKYTRLKIKATFKVWMPESELAYNGMLGTLKAAGIISQRTATEKCTISLPDEIGRLIEEKELEASQKNAINIK